MLFAFHRSAVQAIPVGAIAKIVSPEKIVFGAGADDRRNLFAVDEEHVIAFAEPEILVLQHGHGAADEVAFAGGVHPDVIVLAVGVLDVVHSWIAFAFPVVGGAVIGLGLAELRVKVQRVLRQRMRESTIVEIEIEGIAFFLAII